MTSHNPGPITGRAVRERWRVTLHNPAAHGAGLVSVASGEGSTMPRAFKRAVAAAGEPFLTAGRDYCAIACFAFGAARQAMMRYPLPDVRAAFTDRGFTVSICKVRSASDGLA